MRTKLFSMGLLAALSACGGGGGGSGTPPVEPPSLSVVSMSPASSSTGVNADSGTLSATLRVHGYTNPSSGYVLTCGADTIQSDGNPADQWNAATEQLVVSATYAELPGSTNCEMSGILRVDTPPGGTANTLGWSLKFTTAAVQPLRYGPTVVGIWGGRMFAMTIAKPYALRRDVSPPPAGMRAAPTPWLIGTALTPSGRVPTGYSASGSSGPFAVSFRFNPVTNRTTGLLSTDPFPAGHSYTGSAGSFQFGPGWLYDIGGVGPAPTATAKYWAGDGSGGWFYVEAADLETLLHRDAAGTIETVSREAGRSFTALRTLSNL